jgi:hypothetical protein
MDDHMTSSCWGTWILACVLPPRDLEALIGDLAEEHALRSTSTSAWHLSLWYWGQIARSIPVLLAASIRRGGWMATLGTALAACLVQAFVELGAKSAISDLAALDPLVLGIFSWIVGLPSLVLVSFLAARVRPGAATLLTAIIVIAVVIQLFLKGHEMPFWKQIAAVFIGPAAAFAGGVFSLRTTAGATKEERSP